MKASELIAELQKLIPVYGDLDVFATVDYDWLDLPYYCDASWMDDENPNKIPQYRMDCDYLHGMKQ